MRVVARVAGVVAIMVLGWLFWLPASLGGYMTYAVVSGQSMQPTYYTGDFVVARAQPSYDVGDVVVFRTEDEDVIHRIVGGDSESGYVTQGDNNPELDRWVSTTEEIRGKSVLHMPGVGPSVLVLHELVTTSPFLQVLAGMLVMAAALREFWKSRLRTSGHVAA